jgi:ABC-type nitrate/sulfonate/bicarbonate transport system permease component
MTSARRRALLARTLVVLGFLVLWELVAATGLVDPEFISSPTRAVGALGELSGDEQAWRGVAQTGREVLLAFVIGTSAGFLAGLGIGTSQILHRAYLAPVMFLLSTPKVVFLPVFVLFFGLDELTAALFGAFQAFFYVVVNTVAGVDLVEPRHLTVARSFRAGRWQRLVTVIGPAAMPGIFTALWYGLRNSFIGVLVAEVWISQVGIGRLVRIYANNFDTDKIMATVLVVTVVLIAAGSAWNVLEARLTRWRGAALGTTVPGGGR